jgi:hypothetical protein
MNTPPPADTSIVPTSVWNRDAVDVPIPPPLELSTRSLVDPAAPTATLVVMPPGALKLIPLLFAAWIACVIVKLPAVVAIVIAVPVPVVVTPLPIVNAPVAAMFTTPADVVIPLVPSPRARVPVSLTHTSFSVALVRTVDTAVVIGAPLAPKEPPVALKASVPPLLTVPPVLVIDPVVAISVIRALFAAPTFCDNTRLVPWIVIVVPVPVVVTPLPIVNAPAATMSTTPIDVVTP